MGCAQQFLTLERFTYVFLAGVALDFCVGSTMVDAYNRGFCVRMIRDCTAGISEHRIRALDRLVEAADSEYLQYVDLASTELFLSQNQTARHVRRVPDHQLTMAGLGGAETEAAVSARESYKFAD